MAVETTPLGFQKPDDNELFRDGNEVISANADKADQRIREDRATLATHAARLANLDNAAGFTGDPLALNDAAFAETLTNGTATQAALEDRLDIQVPPIVAEAIAADPTVASSAATMAQSTAGLVPVWKASTAYVAGQRVIAPNGDVVAAKIDFTSGASYSAANWNASTQDGRIVALETRTALPMTDVVSGNDLNDFRTRGQFLVRDNATAAGVVNIPSAGAGVLDVDATASGIIFQTYRAYGTTGGLFYRQTSGLSPTPFPWRAWVRVDQPKSLAYTDLTTGADFNEQRTPGKYRVISSTLAASMSNVPGTTKRSGVLSVDAFDSGITFQTYQEYAGTIWYRATSSVGSSPFPYSAWSDLAAQPAPVTTNNAYVGLANAIRVQDFSQRRGGVKKTGGLGAVAFRFDHGLNNFKTEVLPLLQAYGIVGSLALNSRQWTAAENNAVTQSEVNGWVTAGTVEIWNHTATHADASTYSALSDTIVTGLTELRAQLPAAVIDGFVIPGVGGGTNLGGLNSGTTPENFYGTDAGRLILENHAVSTGAFLGTDRRFLDGTVRQGMGHWTMDSQTSANLISRVQGIQSAKKGLQFMLHPSLLNTPGYMTTADLDAVLSFVASERDGGRLKVYSPYDLLLADATT